MTFLEIDHENEAKVLSMNALLRFFGADDERHSPWFFYCFFVRLSKLAEKRNVKIKDQEKAYNESKLSVCCICICFEYLR